MRVRVNTEPIAAAAAAGVALWAAGQVHEAAVPSRYTPGSVGRDDSVGGASPGKGAGRAATGTYAGTGSTVFASRQAVAPQIMGVQNDTLQVFPGAVYLRITRAWVGQGTPAYLRGSFWQVRIPENKQFDGEEQVPHRAQGQQGAGKSRGNRNAGPVTERGKILLPSGQEKPLVLKLVSTDLTDDAHGQRIPSLTIQPWRNLYQVTDTGNIHPWVAKLDAKSVPSGSYQGYISVTRKVDGRFTVSPSIYIPVRIDVRDPAHMAIAILIVGSLVSLGLELYRQFRLKRDSLYWRIWEAEQLVVSDVRLAEPKEVGAPFRQAIALHLQSAVSLLDGPTLSFSPLRLQTIRAVESALLEAQNVWGKWQRERPEWVAGLLADRHAIDALKAHSQQTDLGRTLRKHREVLLTDLQLKYAAAPTMVSGKSYRDFAIERAEAAQNYITFSNYLWHMRTEVGQAPTAGAERKNQIACANALLEQWETADPADSKALDTLKQQLRQQAETLGLPTSATGGAAPVAERTVRAVWDIEPDSEKELIPRRFQARLNQASTARIIYAWVVTILVYLGLVVFGYQQTYAANDTFGADKLTDYLAVVTWALGVSLASRATLTAFAGGATSAWNLEPTGDGTLAGGMDTGNDSSSGTQPEAATGNTTAQKMRLQHPMLRRL